MSEQLRVVLVLFCYVTSQRKMSSDIGANLNLADYQISSLGGLKSQNEK